jgi:hypothetical protein
MTCGNRLAGSSNTILTIATINAMSIKVGILLIINAKTFMFTNEVHAGSFEASFTLKHSRISIFEHIH